MTLGVDEGLLVTPADEDATDEPGLELVGADVLELEHEELDGVNVGLDVGASEDVLSWLEVVQLLEDEEAAAELDSLVVTPSAEEVLDGVNVGLDVGASEDVPDWLVVVQLLEDEEAAAELDSLVVTPSAEEVLDPLVVEGLLDSEDVGLVVGVTEVLDSLVLGTLVEVAAAELD